MKDNKTLTSAVREPRRREKWLAAIFVILSIAQAVHLFDGDYWKVRHVQKYIEKVDPQWKAFKRANPGFDSIELFASGDAAYGAKLKARGTLSSYEREKQLYKFVASTQPPPYPFDTLEVKVNDVTEYITAEELERSIKSGKLNRLQNGSEPGGPANGSQPIRSETNRTSSAAGSRR